MSAREGEAIPAGEAAVTAVAPRIEIRPIRADDKQALEDGYERLSDSSRYRRFLSPHLSLRPAELRYLTEIDHHDHEARVAIDRASGVKSFTALVLADNDLMLNLISELGVVHDVRRQQGKVELIVDLPRTNHARGVVNSGCSGVADSLPSNKGRSQTDHRLEAHHESSRLSRPRPAKLGHGQGSDDR
jgi:hypothetical protein